jgi:hypothetical protein
MVGALGCQDPVLVGVSVRRLVKVIEKDKKETNALAPAVAQRKPSSDHAANHM